MTGSHMVKSIGEDIMSSRCDSLCLCLPLGRQGESHAYKLKYVGCFSKWPHLKVDIVLKGNHVILRILTFPELQFEVQNICLHVFYKITLESLKQRIWKCIQPSFFSSCILSSKLCWCEVQMLTHLWRLGAARVDIRNGSIWNNGWSIISKLLTCNSSIVSFIHPQTGLGQSQVSHTDTVGQNCLENKDSTTYPELMSAAEMILYMSQMEWGFEDP